MQAISVIAKALRTKKLRDMVVEELSRLLPGGLRREIAYRVEREGIELFRRRLKAEGISPGTISYYVRYPTRFLDSVGWTLTPETLQGIYTIERPRVMRKTAEALKKFIDTVVRVREP